MSRTRTPSPRRRGLPGGRMLAAIVLAVAAAAVLAPTALAGPGQTYVSGVTFPFNGVWLDSADGGHYWGASGHGLCRIDPDPANPGGFIENAATCDVQAKKPTQAVVDPKTMSTTKNSFLYPTPLS